MSNMRFIPVSTLASGAELGLRALDPVATLRRGFSVVQRADTDQVVTTTGQVADGDGLSITVSDGVIPARAGSSQQSKTPGKRRQLKAKPQPMERLL